MEQQNTRAYVAELVGTLLLVLFIGFVVVVDAPDMASIGLVHFLVLAALVGTLGSVSGGHFNPAVTLALLSLKKISGANAGIYIVMQTIGATLGALIVKLILNDEGKASNYATPGFKDGVLGSSVGAFALEAIGTFMLVAAIVGTAVIVKNQSAITPLLIGAALGLAVICIGPLTGAGLNPARSFGPGLISGEFGGFGTFLFAYVLGPIVGALLAAGLVNYLYDGEAAKA